MRLRQARKIIAQAGRGRGRRYTTRQIGAAITRIGRRDRGYTRMWVRRTHSIQGSRLSINIYSTLGAPGAAAIIAQGASMVLAPPAPEFKIIFGSSPPPAEAWNAPSILRVTIPFGTSGVVVE